MKLSEQIQDPTRQVNIANDCAQFMEEVVSAKKGIGGMAFKAVYKALKGIKPNYIEGAIQRLLPNVSLALDPIWSEGIEKGNPVEHLNQNSSTTADLILSVTDARIENTSNKIVRVSYNQVRKSVKTEIEQSIPGLSQILSNHIQF